MVISGAIPCEKIKMREVFIQRLKKEYGRSVIIEIDGDYITYSCEVPEHMVMN